MSFDAVVIGSSPICIMKAVELKKKGLSVIVIDKDIEVGGAWKTINTEHFGRVEQACHLIEFYAGGYEKIGALLDIEFEVMNPQPVSIYKNGKKRLYLSRILIFKGFLYQFFLLGSIFLIRAFNRLTPNRVDIKKGKKISIRFLKEDILLILFKRILHIITFPSIKQPKEGYTIITRKILEALNKHKIQKIYGCVKTIEIENNECVILFEDESISASRVYISESTGIDIPCMLENKRVSKFKTTSYFHVLVQVDKAESNKIPGYIHFPDSVDFHRITRHPLSADEKYKYSVFLVQIRKPFHAYKNLIFDIRNIFFECGIIEDEITKITIVDTFENCHLSSSADCKYPYGNYMDSRIEILKSIGDLGKIAACKF